MPGIESIPEGVPIVMLQVCAVLGAGAGVAVVAGGLLWLVIWAEGYGWRDVLVHPSVWAVPIIIAGVAGFAASRAVWIAIV